MAERSGPDFLAVLRQPFALTLYAFLQLKDRDRVADLRQRDRDVRLGVYMAHAMNDPKRLEEERANVLAEMRSPPTAIAQASALERARETGRALAARIEAGKVLD